MTDQRGVLKVVSDDVADFDDGDGGDGGGDGGDDSEGELLEPAKGWCWLRHLWSIWYREDWDSTRQDGTKYSVTYQVRECLNCGLEQKRGFD